MLCCSYTVVWWLFQSLPATFTLLTSKDAPPKMKREKERHEWGETSRATQSNNLTKKLFSPRDGEKTFSFLASSRYRWRILCRFDEGAKNLFQMGKLGRVLFVFLLSQQRLDLCFFSRRVACDWPIWNVAQAHSLVLANGQLKFPF